MHAMHEHDEKCCITEQNMNTSMEKENSVEFLLL